MTPTYANLTASNIEEARRYSDKLRKLPSVRHVQSPGDILPDLHSAELQSLRDFFTQAERTPEFTQFTKHPLTTEQAQQYLQELNAAVHKIQAVMTDARDEAKEHVLNTCLKN